MRVTKMNMMKFINQYRKISIIRTYLLIFLILSTCPFIAKSDEYYKATVSRVESNIYKVEYTYPPIYIITKFCFQYSFYEDAIVELNPIGGRLIFTNSKSTCDIKELVR